jgi:hypothetical protein
VFVDDVAPTLVGELDVGSGKVGAGERLRHRRENGRRQGWEATTPLVLRQAQDAFTARLTP